MDFEARRAELIALHNNAMQNSQRLTAQVEEIVTAATEMRGQIALLEQLIKEEADQEKGEEEEEQV